MRVFFLFLMVCLFLQSCDDTRVFEDNIDFENRCWLIQDKPVFEFIITDTTVKYTLYGNIRNAEHYPNSRLFFTYYLKDSINKVLQTKLTGKFLFDPKTGKPYGSSGLGDIYSHQIPLLQNHQFDYPGKYKVEFEQFMRKDTLDGILTVGLRVERSEQEEK